MLDLDLLIAPAEYRREMDSPDGRVHWTEIGSGDPLLFVQSWGPLPATTAWMTVGPVASLLADRYRCILIDLPNFGLSGPLQYNEPVHDIGVRNVIRVLDHLGIDRLPVVGGSIGGTTALDLELQHPERVAALFLGSCHVSTGGDPYVLAPGPSEAARNYLELMSDPDNEATLRRMLVSMVYDESLITDALVEQMIALRARSADHLAAETVSTSVGHSNLSELKRVSAPLRLFHGRFDRMVPVEQALQLSSYITHADLVLFNKTGHWPAFERPEAYARELTTFLDSVATLAE
jgi:pimeloyl-ACP methyl ester carboxylesterase